MKKVYKILFISISLWLSLNQQIQSQSTIGIEVGYGFPWATDDVSDGNVKFLDNGITEIETFKTSHGAGISYSLSFNYPVNSWMEGKCLVSYLDGTSATKTIQSSTNRSNDSYKGNMVWISPTLVFKLSKQKISPYAFLGFMAGIGGKITEKRENSSANGMSESKNIYTHGTALGISSGLGLKFYPGKRNRWGMFCEAKIISASYGPKRRKLVKLTRDGVDVLGPTTVSDRITVFKNKHQIDWDVPSDPTEPSINSREFYPFSSLGLNVGFFYAL